MSAFTRQWLRAGKCVIRRPFGKVSSQGSVARTSAAERRCIGAVFFSRKAYGLEIEIGQSDSTDARCSHARERERRLKTFQQTIASGENA